MPSNLVTVPQYFETLPPARLEAIHRLRNVCLKKLMDFEESMENGKPAFNRNWAFELGFNSQKQYISLYILRKDVPDKYFNKFPGISLEAVCIRYTTTEKNNFDLVVAMPKDTCSTTGKVCGQARCTRCFGGRQHFSVAALQPATGNL